MAEALTLETVHRELCHEIQVILALKPGAITPDTYLPDMGIDSLRFVSLLLAIEKKFGVNLMKVGLKKDEMKTVKTISAVIMARRKA